MTPSLSVVMPAYNEAASIDRAIGEVVECVFSVVADAELVVVDDGSRDATAEHVRRWSARDPRVRLVQRANGGHGAALMSGLEAARASRCLLVDADAQIALDRFGETWTAAATADAVIGVRHPRRDPLHRLVLTRVVRAVLRFGYGVPYADANVPYKLVRRAWCERLRAAAPPSPAIPSILLALLLARDRARVVEQVVAHRERAGGVGSLRAGRLMRFCLRAWRELRAFARVLPAPPA